MAAKKKPKPNELLSLYRRQDETPDAAMARQLTQPEITAAVTIQIWQDAMDVNAVVDELRQQTEILKSGDMHRAESTLLAQAQTLDELFNNLARRAKSSEYLSQFEVNLRLALRAQNQCRMTLESLSNIKNPPVIYAKQANISHGPQQINNGVPATHTAENQNQQNELLTVNHGETLDSSRTGETIGGNQAMATVEKQHRAKNGSRKAGGGA